MSVTQQARRADVPSCVYDHTAILTHTHTHTVCVNRVEFTISKLRHSGNHQGLYVLRCSPRDYSKYFMSFVVGVSACRCSVRPGEAAHAVAVFIRTSLCSQYESRVGYKHCQIMKTEEGQYILSGAKKSFGSLRELMHCYQKEALRSDGYTFQLTRCCPPTLKGLENASKAQHTFRICPHGYSCLLELLTCSNSEGLKQQP